MLRNNADARRCSYFELGLPVSVVEDFLLIVIFKGRRPSSALQATLEALLFTSKQRLQNWRCVFDL